MTDTAALLPASVRAEPVGPGLRRRAFGAGALGVAALAAVGGLGGCASMNQITVDMASFGSWPAGRARMALSPARWAGVPRPARPAGAADEDGAAGMD